MKLLVIVTRMYVDCENMHDEFTQWGCNKDIHKEDIHKFNEYAFLCIQGCKYKSDIESGKIDETANNILKVIQNKIQNQILNGIGIIFHPHYEADTNSQDTVLQRWGIFVETFKEKKDTNINSIQISFIETYHHTENCYEMIKTLCENCRGTQNGNCEELIRELWGRFSKEKKIEKSDEILSRLQHIIMNIFLPLDIDWQGIKSALEEDRSKAEHYFDDVKGSIKGSNLLKSLWFYLAGEKISMGEKINDIILPDKKSIYDIKCDIINNTNDEEKKRKINDIWQEILIHVGLKQGFTKDSDSNFVKFLEGIENQTINEFLRSFTINGKNYNFHTWYLKLGELLDELKKIAGY